jgi:hypothetical protein
VAGASGDESLVDVRKKREVRRKKKGILKIKKKVKKKHPTHPQPRKTRKE